MIKVLSVLIVFICLAMTVQVYAQQAPASALAVGAEGQVNPEDAGALLKGLVEAFKGGKWALGVSLLTMLLTFGLNRIPWVQKRIPSAALPWVAVGLALLTQLFTSLAGGAVWYEAFLSAFLQGAGAAGLWSLIGKHVLPSNPQS